MKKPIILLLLLSNGVVKSQEINKDDFTEHPILCVFLVLLIFLVIYSFIKNKKRDKKNSLELPQSIVDKPIHEPRDTTSFENTLRVEKHIITNSPSSLEEFIIALPESIKNHFVNNYAKKISGYNESPFGENYYLDGSNNNEPIDLSNRDPLFDEAARLIVIQQQGSVSLIQRKFAIGYNRAGRIMDQLEASGIVGPFEGSKHREVMLNDEYSLETLLNSLR